MSKTVADVLVGVLEQIGVKHIFGLIGDSLNPLADAVRRSKVEWIGVRHEEGAALAAAGQAKLTGQLAVCAGTTGPGSNHLVAGLYEACRDHAPVLALSGDMPRKFHGTDYIQTTEPDLLFRDVSLYTETIASAAQAGPVIHQAMAAAYAGPGVAHLTLPQDVLATKAEGSVASIATLRPRPEFAANEHDVAELARRIDAVDRIVIMCGAGCRGAIEELQKLSDRLKAPLVHSFRGKELMAYDDPRWMGGLGIIGTRPVYEAVRDCELLLMVGTDYPYSNFLPDKGKVIQVDVRPQVLGRRAPTTLGVTGSARPTLTLLLGKVAPKTDGLFWDLVTRERRKWDEMLDKQADLRRSKDKLHPQVVARAVSDLANPDAIFAVDTGLNTLWSANWIRQTGSQRILGSFNNAAVGNMLMGEFLTAAEHKLAVKVVIYNNSSLGLIKLEAESVGLVPFRRAIEFPNPDFAALARACGGHGFLARNPAELMSALPEAFAAEGPEIVDAVVVADEMPNLPHVDLEQVGHFALAKIKEAVLAVTGG